jgi:hypothetical protein
VVDILSIQTPVEVRALFVAAAVSGDGSGTHGYVAGKL